MNAIIQNKKDLIFYKKNIIDKIKKLAEKTPNKRARLCIHQSIKNKTNEMIIALKKGSYIQPHIHPNSKSESYHVIEGKMNVFIFSKDGKKKKVIKMGDYKSNLNFFYRMNRGYFHLPIAVSRWCVYHEIYSGPFKKNLDVKYAKWAPKESDKLIVNKFLKKIGF
jgi:cupin fold WbuC family metalloprotein